ncbi:MAG: hypothetical protein H6718_32280 [Polyangiaceae bacterium]|nr:hypothetical protein [Myxococcales bacterium]MCB9590136.1 hypothetical protein [Polyangiaceae bacterium]MCB9608015.1 hypothetical protein [Polyangiaceae bacterium]
MLTTYLEKRSATRQVRGVPNVQLAARMTLETIALWAIHVPWDPSPRPFSEDEVEERCRGHEGKLVLAFRPESDDIPNRFRDPTYRFPRAELQEAALQRVGLKLERWAHSAASLATVLMTAIRP